MKNEDYEEREVGGSERHYRGGTEFIIGFEGSQALPFVLLVGVSIHRYYGSLIVWHLGC
jgi:hypothetical protein